MGLKRNLFSVGFLHDRQRFPTETCLQEGRHPVVETTAANGGGEDVIRTPRTVHFAIDVHIFIFMATTVLDKPDCRLHASTSRGARAKVRSTVTEYILEWPRVKVLDGSSRKKMKPSESLSDEEYVDLVSNIVCRLIRSHSEIISKRLRFGTLKSIIAVWFLAYDGIAPPAKFIEQQARRKRRLPHRILDNENLKKQFSACLVRDLQQAISADSPETNSESCGTKSIVVVSPHTNPGEGEYKCFRYCASLEPSINNTTSTVILSRDSDLFVYVLCAPKSMAQGDNYIYYIESIVHSSEVQHYAQHKRRKNSLIRYDALYYGLRISVDCYFSRCLFAKGVIGLCGNDYIPPVLMNNQDANEKISFLSSWVRANQTGSSDRPSLMSRKDFCIASRCKDHRLNSKYIFELLTVAAGESWLRKRVNKKARLSLKLSKGAEVFQKTAQVTAAAAAVNTPHVKCSKVCLQVEALNAWANYVDNITAYFQSAFDVTKSDCRCTFFRVVSPTEDNLQIVTQLTTNTEFNHICNQTF